MDSGLLPSQRRHVRRLLERSVVHYSQQYILLYISYNAWYQYVTGTTNEREAHRMLKMYFMVWERYERGVAMKDLVILMRWLCDHTQREPFFPKGSWSGEVQHVYDWQGLIEFWYQVRCIVVHGGVVPGHIAKVAYESLRIFMHEVLKKDVLTPLLTP